MSVHIQVPTVFMCILQRMGIRVACFEDFISSLNCHGYLLKKGAKTYQLQTFN